MPELNASIPQFECFVRDEFLYGLQRGHGEFTPGMCHAISAVPGRAMGFHVLLNNGAHIGRLPIHAVVTKDKAPAVDVEKPWLLQLWDVFAANVSVVEYDYLSGMRCRAVLADKSIHGGEYLFTVDYWGSSAAEAAGDGGWKAHNVCALDNGWLCALPNNRLCFFEPSLVRPFERPPDYVTMPRTWKVEDGSKWRTSDDDRMFYGVEELKGERRG